MSQLRALLPIVGAVVLAAACSTAQPLVGRFSTPRAGPPVVLAPLIASGPCSSTIAGHPVPIDPGRGDRVVLVRDGKRTLAYVANEDDDALHTIDVAAGTELAVTQLTGSPSALVGLRDGRIAVALRDRNQVSILEPAASPSSPLVARCARSVASEPVGLATADAAGESEGVLVSSGYGHALTVLREGDLEVSLEVDLPRDPRAIVVDGRRAYVSHLTSSKLSAVDLDSGVVASVDVLSGQKPRGTSFRSALDTAKEPEPIHGGQVFALARADGRLFAPMVTVDPGEPKITGAYGSTEVPIKPLVGVVDLASAASLPIPFRSIGTPARRACMLPRAAAASTEGRLFVTCAGIDELLELDGRADNAAEAIRRRVRVAAGPLGLAVDDREAVVMAQFDHRVVIVPFDAKAAVVEVGLSRPAAPVDDSFERGRKIFHDNFDLRVSGDGRACASCHPDGRDDGNTWSTPDGPRQTIPLGGRIARSAPYGWFGNHKTLDSHLGETMRRLKGQGFSAPGDRADLAALEAYLAKMKAPVAEAVEDPQVAEGRALFNDAKQGCATCHVQGDTDRVRHDVGSGHAEEASIQFDTPSLLFVSASGPYFHDGRYASLDELLAKSNDRMGHASHLDGEQRSAIVAYMDTLAAPMPAAESVARTFVAPETLGAIAPDAANALERGVLSNQPPPFVLENVPIDLAAIPTIDVTPELAWDPQSPIAQGLPLAPDELVVRNGCMAVAHHAAAHLKISWFSVSMTSKLERCLSGPSEDGTHHWTDMEMTTIDPNQAGSLHVVESRGFVRTGKSEMRLSSRYEVDAMRVGDGLAFVYRTRCVACKEGGRDLLHVVAPSNGDLFTTSQLSLEPDRAGHVGGATPPWQLGDWSKATGTQLESGSKTGDPISVMFRIDATRTRSESEARITIGRGHCRPDFFTCE